MVANSIRRDLSSRIGLIILCVNLLVGIVYYSYSSHYAQKDFESYTTQITDNIADILASQLWLVDLKAAREISDLVLDATHLQGLQLRDHHGEYIYSYDFTVDHTTVHLTRELYHESVLVGYLDVFFSNRALSSVRRSQLIAGALMVCGTVLASFFALNLLLSKYLSAPLHDLQLDMKTMADGAFPRSKMKQQKQEVQDIVDAFNNLAEKLKQREEEVAEKTSSLTREVLERRKTAELLRLSQENWERTFDAMKDIVIIFDDTMHIVQANQAAYDFLQYPPEEVVGLECKYLFREEDFSWTECVENISRKKFSHENRIFSNTPTDQVFNTTVVPIFDNKGAIVKFVFTATDITLQKELEAELFQAQKMETVGTLAGGIAHDFNNILAAIIGYSELALSTEEDFDEAKGYIQKALDGSYRARELIKQILTFSRKGSQVKELIRPDLILKEALQLLRASIPSTIDIRENIYSVDGLISADATRIHQVIVNICTNAVHAMEEEHGELIIDLQEVVLDHGNLTGFPEAKPGRFARLSISDTGIGMTSDQINHIFEPYFTTKEVGKGSGLGLALVHAIVVDCGGVIRVESKQGKGSTFVLYFPLTSSTLEAGNFEKTGDMPSGNGEHIVVVDDEAPIADLVKTSLEKLGYKVTIFFDSDDAIQALSSSPEEYDLLITDQTMPGCTGIELARKVLQIKADLPVLLCTGYSTRVSPEILQEAGIRGFAMKPVSRSILARKVHNLLHPETQS